MDYILLNRADASTPNPAFRMRAGLGFGWANSQFGHQFWILTPPGRYLSTICGDGDLCKSVEDAVREGESMGLHIPFLVEVEDNGFPRVTKGKPSDLAVEDGSLILEGVRWFSIRRLE